MNVSANQRKFSHIFHMLSYQVNTYLTSFLFVSTSFNLLAWIEKCLNNKLRVKSGTCEEELQVNSTVFENFRGGLFSRKFADTEFRENKP